LILLLILESLREKLPIENPRVAGSIPARATFSHKGLRVFEGGPKVTSSARVPQI
jgi:hypothetical protein